MRISYRGDPFDWHANRTETHGAQIASFSSVPMTDETQFGHAAKSHEPLPMYLGKAT
jgi:hypothetical protein